MSFGSISIALLKSIIAKSNFYWSIYADPLKKYKSESFGFIFNAVDKSRIASYY
jgi:hypothetical protein